MLLIRKKSSILKSWPILTSDAVKPGDCGLQYCFQAARLTLIGRFAPSETGTRRETARIAWTHCLWKAGYCHSRRMLPGTSCQILF